MGIQEGPQGERTHKGLGFETQLSPRPVPMMGGSHSQSSHSFHLLPNGSCVTRVPCKELTPIKVRQSWTSWTGSSPSPLLGATLNNIGPQRTEAHKTEITELKLSCAVLGHAWIHEK